MTLPAMSTVDGDTLSVDLIILSDNAVEGLHSFMASVEASSLVVPGSDATINIVDNDSENMYIISFIHISTCHEVN